MKHTYSNPIIKIAVFGSENTVTTSMTGIPAIDAARSNIGERLTETYPDTRISQQIEWSWQQ